MIAELGHYCLIMALFLALVQSVVPMIGAARNDVAYMAVAPMTAIGQMICLTVSFAALIYAFVNSDFSVLNVVQNSHSLKPMLYKVSGAWGNHEGSLLLWVAILALFGSLVAFFGKNLPPGLKARTLSVQAMVTVGFLLFILFTSNPFDRVFPPPLEGRDLNPLLQDPGLAFHPPMLYIGYVGLSITFSFAVAALLEGKVDAAWARYVRPWTLLSWSFLTGGIALGSWWAYYELGWGGFWFWDPVENASFMPWLAATALLHSAIVVEKRDALKAWTILLAIIGFSLSLIGTFLVRSGVLTSVHAFANDPDRGLFILILLVLAIGGSLTLFAYRAPVLRGGNMFKPVSREGALLFNNLLLTTACATVLLGTLYPLLLEVTTGGKVSVGPPYFNATFVPLMMPLFAALAVGPLLSWKRADLKGALMRLRLAAVVVVGITCAAAVALYGQDAYALIGLAVAAWLVVGALFELGQRIGIGKVDAGRVFQRAIGLPRAAWGMTVAHIGVGVLVAGATGATLLTTEVITVVKPGETFDLADYKVEFVGPEEFRGPNYFAQRGNFVVRDEDGEPLSFLSPEKRRYVASGQETTEAAIETHFTHDLYLVIGDRNAAGGYTVRAYKKRLAPWLWIGSTMMVLGGFISLSDRRLRIGAPKRTHDKPPSRNAPSPSPAE